MYVTLHSFRARPGEEDAVVALHEDWARRSALSMPGFLHGELLVDDHNPRCFTAIRWFTDEASALAEARDLERQAWCRRLASLTDAELHKVHYRMAWRNETRRPIVDESPPSAQERSP